jgi:uncharacterized membrane protein (UPF0127 family)
MRAVKINSTSPLDNYKARKEVKEVIATDVVEAAGFLSKLSGLIARKKLKDNEGFLIKNCSSIHTIGMRYCIDAVFLDEKNYVLKIYYNIKPFRITPFIKDAFCVLETAAGIIKKTSLKEKDLVYFEA